MRILLTSTGHWGTGSFTAIDSIIFELTKKGHEVRVFMPEPASLPKSASSHDRPLELYERWRFPIENGGVKLPTFPLIIPDPHPNNPNAYTYKDLTKDEFHYFFQELTAVMRRLIDDFKPDVIECNHIWSMAYVMSTLKIPYLVTAHNSDQMGFYYDERMRPYAIQAAEQARFVIAISEKNKNDVLNLYKINSDKVFIIPNSYNAEIFKPQKTLDRSEVLRSLKLDIPKDAVIINLAGKISRTKGVDVLLQANYFLQQQYANNIHILILGAGEFSNVLDPDKMDTYCFKNVHALGHVHPETLAKIHAISKLSVVPSRSEGFPISCTEAMGCARPVVITELGGAENYAVGIVIPQEDPKALADAILHVTQLGKNNYQALCENALSAAQSFSWEKNVEKRLHLYERLRAM